MNLRCRSLRTETVMLGTVGTDSKSMHRRFGQSDEARAQAARQGLMRNRAGPDSSPCGLRAPGRARFKLLAQFVEPCNGLEPLPGWLGRHIWGEAGRCGCGGSLEVAEGQGFEPWIGY